MKIRSKALQLTFLTLAPWIGGNRLLLAQPAPEARAVLTYSTYLGGILDDGDRKSVV